MSLARMLAPKMGAPIDSASMSALTWVILGRTAWRPLDHWLGIVGRGTAESVLEAGLVVVWDHDHEGRLFRGGPVVTLTTWGAWCVEREVIDGKWKAINQPPRRKLKQDHEPGMRNLEFPERVPDHRAGPAEEAEKLIDEVSGLPVIIWGRSVEIDRRISQPRRAG